MLLQLPRYSYTGVQQRMRVFTAACVVPGIILGNTQAVRTDLCFPQDISKHFHIYLSEVS